MRFDADDGQELVYVVDRELDDGIAHQTPTVGLGIHVLGVSLPVAVNYTNR